MTPFENADFTPLFLAPMAGVTDLSFRSLVKRFSCDITVTEMISSKALYYGSERTDTIITVCDEERPCVAQIFGSDPDIMGMMAKKIICDHENDFFAVDINMGCPATKIVSANDGSALMKPQNLALAGRIIESVVKSVTVPVSVKFRKGWDDNNVNAVEFAKLVESSGARWLTIHARTRAQQYSGTADWDIIAAVKQAVSIPVVANGDVIDGKTAVKIKEQTCCDGIMVGRGAMGNPWIFDEIRAALDGKTYMPPTIHARIAMAKEHALKLSANRGGRAALEMRKHIAWYVNGMYACARLRAKANTCLTIGEIVALLDLYEEEIMTQM